MDGGVASSEVNLLLKNMSIIHWAFFLVLFNSEKEYGEHQLQIGFGNEEWQVCSWLQTNIEDSTAGQSQAGDHS